MSADDAIRLAVAPGPLAGTVVTRLVGIAAARADLPLDRIDDALLLAAALAARAPEHVEGAGDRLRLEVRARPGTLELGVPCLRQGAVRRLLGDPAAPGAEGNVFRRVATRAEGGRDATGAERLVLEIAGAVA